METLNTSDLYNAFALVGKDREQAMPYLIGMMSACLDQKDFENILETIRVNYQNVRGYRQTLDNKKRKRSK